MNGTSLAGGSRSISQSFVWFPCPQRERFIHKAAVKDVFFSVVFLLHFPEADAWSHQTAVK